MKTQWNANIQIADQWHVSPPLQSWGRYTQSHWSAQYSMIRGVVDLWLICFNAMWVVVIIYQVERVVDWGWCKVVVESWRREAWLVSTPSSHPYFCTSCCIWAHQLYHKYLALSFIPQSRSSIRWLASQVWHCGQHLTIQCWRHQRGAGSESFLQTSWRGRSPHDGGRWTWGTAETAWS